MADDESRLVTELNEQDVTYVYRGRSAAAGPGLGGGYDDLLLEANGDLLDNGPTGVVGQVSLALLWRWCH